MEAFSRSTSLSDNIQTAGLSQGGPSGTKAEFPQSIPLSGDGPAPEEIACRKGDVIFSDGDSGDTMYIVLAGRVKILKQAKGVKKTLALLGEGEFFGEMGVVSGKPRSATAVAEEDCRLQVLGRGDFLRMVQCDRREDRKALSVIEKLCDRLRDTDMQIGNLLIADHINRVADALCRAEIGSTAEDMAGIVGLPKERVREVLRKLEAAGAVSMTARGFSMVDPGKVRTYRDVKTQIVDTRGEDDALRVHRMLKTARHGTWFVLLGDSGALREQVEKLAETLGCRVIESVLSGDGEWQMTVEL